jgi:hypothetical protein
MMKKGILVPRVSTKKDSAVETSALIDDGNIQIRWD